MPVTSPRRRLRSGSLVADKWRMYAAVGLSSLISFPACGAASDDAAGTRPTEGTRRDTGAVVGRTSDPTGLRTQSGDLPVPIAEFIGDDAAGEAVIDDPAGRAGAWVSIDPEHSIFVWPFPETTTLDVGLPVLLEGTITELPEDPTSEFGIESVDASRLHADGAYLRLMSAHFI